MTHEPGTFHARHRAEQLLSFVGLRWGKITPTDFDLFIDFGGRGFVLGEIKYRDAPLHRGQELALERAADAWDKAGIPTLTLVASHSTDIGDVIVADASVVRFRWKGQWHDTKQPITVGAAVNRFHQRCTETAA